MKKILIAFLAGALFAGGVLYSPGIKAETRLYVSEDVLSKILSALEEIKANQATTQNREELREIKQLSIKVDQLLYLQQQVLQELHKIKLRI
jgi:hypothetical protein